MLSILLIKNVGLSWKSAELVCVIIYFSMPKTGGGRGAIFGGNTVCILYIEISTHVFRICGQKQQKTQMFFKIHSHWAIAKANT